MRSWTALVSAYWSPVYTHLRLRWKKSRPDAEDLTQGFFHSALEREFFNDYDPGKARFRTFVRVCLDRFVQNEEKAKRRQKRGGDAGVITLDFDAAEEQLERVASSDASPEELFDRQWRRSLFALGVDSLRDVCAQSGKEAHFALFERYDLSDDGERPTYDRLAADLGLPVTSVTNHLAWARRELRRLVLEKLEAVSGSESEFRHETATLFKASPGRIP